MSFPLSTYRVQFQPGCGFVEVARAVPYLHALGISHLYSSPYLRARGGSTHGYDIVDHASLNPEVGDEEQHQALCRTLRWHGMEQILDIVPNHMGVLEADNAWWLDVLEHGRASPYAETFDIEWNADPADTEAGAAGGTARLLLPVLGDQYGRVLEAGELQLRFDAAAGSFSLHYFGHRFPLDPSDYPAVLAASPVPDSAQAADGAALIEAFGRLPQRDTPDAQARSARRGDSALLQRRLAELAASSPRAAGWIEDGVKRLNGTPGDAASFDALDALVARQAFRLAHWRVAGDDVNYRRFFDVNGLAGLRTEREEVFEATHARVLRWLHDGSLSGLRIDHPDGLADPQQYFERLRTRHAELMAETARDTAQAPAPLYLVVEKILAEHEALPPAWPVQGGTGYRFANLVHGLFVDARQQGALDRVWRSFTGETASFETLVYQAKKLVVDQLLSSELHWLAGALHRMLRRQRRTCDFTHTRLLAALAELAAAFPVYRTYLRAGEPPSAADRQHIDWATAAAKRRLGAPQAEVLDQVRDVLLGEGEAAALPSAERARFLARWQQFTAPVMAKAVEDTVFYRYLRLSSLNDVGGDPGRFGVSSAAFHVANQTRLRFWPHALLASSTHDSKRSEDLRARIGVLSEMPAVWEEHLLRLSGWAELYVTQTDSGPAPSRRDSWLLFQTLAGLWPATPPDAEEREALRQRLQAYMLKAVREAKDRTSWTSPDAAYEEALARYVDAVLRPGPPNPFADELQRLTERIAVFGFRNSLAQLALKLTVPGVPDLYQGCERWSFRLVDPDNRALVDFEALATELRALTALYAQGFPSPAEWQGLLHGIADGRVKQLATWRLLQLRRLLAPVFQEGSYVPVEVRGEAAEHVLAFCRRHDQGAVLVVAARWTCTLCAADKPWGPDLWAGTALHGEALAGPWQNWLTGQALQGTEAIALAQLFPTEEALPFAVLVQGQRTTPA